MFSGCAAIPFLIPPLIEFGANLLTTASTNYGNFHKQNLENLLVSLQRPTNPALTQGAGVNPNDPYGVYQQPGYPDQGYQTVQGYPSSPDYSQQGYDPYQTQTSPYGTAQGYPSSQDYSQPAYDPYQTQTSPYGTAQGYPSSQDYSQPGYDPYQAQTSPYGTAQGYPPSQGYPSSPDYGQQAYDPYQNQPPQYGGNSSYPNNQGQLGNQYPTNPGYPNQQASASGYPSYPQNQYPQQGQQPYPNDQTGYPHQGTYQNQGGYSDQAPYPTQGQPYPGTSNPIGQPGQPSPNPYGNTGIPSAPSQPNQYENTASVQPPQPQTGQPGSTPISLDVLLVKKHVVNGVPSYLPIKDGDILQDGRGNPQAGDKFRVIFRPHTDGYVYVIAVDGSAWAQGIFPSASNPFANPVKAGKQYVLPDGNNWFSLDQYKGIETIFFVASHGRRADIEKILTTITGRERSPGEKPQAVSEPAIIPHGYSGTRPGSSPFAFQTSQSQQEELLPTTYFVKTAGEDLRITRWFRHQ